MRPPGDVRLALLSSAVELAENSPTFTFHDLARHANVGFSAARRTLRNMADAGELERAGERKVQGVNRPVREYALPKRAQGVADYSAVLGCWSSQT